jgi:uncharacterized protein (UPF0218 family)
VRSDRAAVESCHDREAAAEKDAEVARRVHERGAEATVGTVVTRAIAEVGLGRLPRDQDGQVRRALGRRSKRGTFLYF